MRKDMRENKQMHKEGGKRSIRLPYWYIVAFFLSSFSHLSATIRRTFSCYYYHSLTQNEIKSRHILEIDFFFKYRGYSSCWKLFFFPNEQVYAKQITLFICLISSLHPFWVCRLTFLPYWRHLLCPLCILDICCFWSFVRILHRNNVHI